MITNPCNHCGKEAPKHHNYCDFNCHIAACKAEGFKEILPNGLPIQCITGNGELLECAGGDHPNYIKPVIVTIHGYHYNFTTDEEEFGPEFSEKEHHALLFYDGNAAISMYENDYFFWVNGRLAYSKYNHYKKHKVTIDLEF